MRSLHPNLGGPPGSSSDQGKGLLTASPRKMFHVEHSVRKPTQLPNTIRRRCAQCFSCSSQVRVQRAHPNLGTLDCAGNTNCRVSHTEITVRLRISRSRKMFHVEHFQITSLFINHLVSRRQNVPRGTFCSNRLEICDCHSVGQPLFSKYVTLLRFLPVQKSWDVS